MLTKVTITGADDTTDIGWMRELSAQYPFVEWAILASSSQEGSYRFPSRDWMKRFSEAVQYDKMNVSTHICGRWVRQMLIGTLEWNELPWSLWVSQRIQINTHGLPHDLIPNLMIGTLQDRPENIEQVIFQLDGINDQLPYTAKQYGIPSSGLYDMSAGAGILPEEWPVASEDYPVGYAGGLGPNNVEEQLVKIRKVAGDKDFWIDMERRVRTEDDSRLDTLHVIRVLDKMKNEAGR